MDTREYIVSLKKDIDYDKFWAEMENLTTGLLHVPNRKVDIMNERKGSLRSCHYFLTDDEASSLRNDSRVYSVEIPYTKRKDIHLVKNLIQTGNFDKTIVAEGNYQNWGLSRCISPENNFGLGTISPNDYEYVLDGSNVDVVIMDSGLMAEHLEFNDDNNVTRVKNIDWYVEAGISNQAPVNLFDSTYSSVCSNSYINFEKLINYFWDFSFETLGGSLIIGSVSLLEYLTPDAASNAIYAGTEDGGRSYRIRFEGRVPEILSDTFTNIVWECRFLNNNMIELLVLRHDEPLKGHWQLNLSTYSEPFDSSKSISLNIFKDERLIGGSVARSCVIATEDNGLSWTVYGNQEEDFHVELDGEDWIVTSGVATERGSPPTMVRIDDSSSSTNGIFQFNTPFNFYCGLATDTPRTIGDDTSGHGTHVAGIVAGKTFGWAKNANIFSLKISGLEGIYDVDTGISLYDAFDLVKLWHQNKSINNETNIKNPTVVNMSFEFASSYTDIVGGSYRGTPWVDTVTKPEYGMIGETHPIRINSIDVDIQEMIDAGIHVVIAAGNREHKVDVSTGLDYNNYYTKTGVGNVYYHRGSSPYDDQAIIVGSSSPIVYDSMTEQRSSFSNHGPGVDIYAPGGNIISAVSWLNEYFLLGLTAPYYPSGLNILYNQAVLSGTSMAAPQVTGVVALLLQLHPEISPDRMKAYLLANSKSTIYSGNESDPYTDPISLQGGNQRFLYHKFGQSKSFTVRFKN